MEKKLLIFILISFSLVSTAQVPKKQLNADVAVFPKEMVKIFVNSDVALAGEALYYKISVLDGRKTPSDLSKIAYVSMRDERDSIIFNHKLRLANGSANSDFFLPAQLKTGIYQLIGYTNFSRNNEDHPVDFKPIYVVNTFNDKQTNAERVDTVYVKNILSVPVDVLNGNVTSGSANIKTDKSVFGLRQKVSVDLRDLHMETGKFLLSVRRINPMETMESLNAPKPQTSPNFFLPELRGELLSGMVVSQENGTPLANGNVAFTIPGKDFILKISKTNHDGRFFISVPENYNVDKSVLQLLETGEDRNKYRIVMDDRELRLKDQPQHFLKFDPNLKDWLTERSVQIQIENAYFEKKQDSVIPLIPKEQFYDNLGTVYKLDDYTRFNTLRETFTEIIKLAAIRGTGLNTRFLVYNPYDPTGVGLFNNIAPLVLLDGTLIQDNEALLEYNAKNIRSIRVVNLPYRYGSKLFSGIISMESIKYDFLLPKSSSVEILNQTPPVRSKILFNNLSAPLTDRIPDYRVQLLWKPNLNLQDFDDGLFFYTSDVKGIYEIKLEGYSEEGKYIFSNKFIEVK